MLSPSDTHTREIQEAWDRSCGPDLFDQKDFFEPQKLRKNSQRRGFQYVYAPDEEARPMKIVIMADQHQYGSTFMEHLAEQLPKPPDDGPTASSGSEEYKPLFLRTEIRSDDLGLRGQKTVQLWDYNAWLKSKPVLEDTAPFYAGAGGSIILVDSRAPPVQWCAFVNAMYTQMMHGGVHPNCPIMICGIYDHEPDSNEPVRFHGSQRYQNSNIYMPRIVLDGSSNDAVEILEVLERLLGNKMGEPGMWIINSKNLDAVNAASRRESSGTAISRRQSTDTAISRRQSSETANSRRESSGTANSRRQSTDTATSRRGSSGTVISRRQSSGNASSGRGSISLGTREQTDQQEDNDVQNGPAAVGESEDETSVQDQESNGEDVGRDIGFEAIAYDDDDDDSASQHSASSHDRRESRRISDVSSGFDRTESTSVEETGRTTQSNRESNRDVTDVSDGLSRLELNQSVRRTQNSPQTRFQPQNVASAQLEDLLKQVGMPSVDDPVVLHMRLFPGYRHFMKTKLTKDDRYNFRVILYFAGLCWDDVVLTDDDGTHWLILYQISPNISFECWDKISEAFKNRFVINHFQGNWKGLIERLNQKYPKEARATMRIGKSDCHSGVEKGEEYPPPCCYDELKGLMTPLSNTWKANPLLPHHGYTCLSSGDRSKDKNILSEDGEVLVTWVGFKSWLAEEICDEDDELTWEMYLMLWYYPLEDVVDLYLESKLDPYDREARYQEDT